MVLVILVITQHVGGAIGTVDNVVVTFNGANVFLNNSANRFGTSNSGGAIFTGFNTSLNFIGTNEFSHNSAEHHGGTIAVGSILAFHWY